MAKYKVYGTFTKVFKVEVEASSVAAAEEKAGLIDDRLWNEIIEDCDFAIQFDRTERIEDEDEKS